MTIFNKDNLQDELLHGLNHILDGCLAADAVAGGGDFCQSVWRSQYAMTELKMGSSPVEKINVVRLEPPQGLLDGAPDKLGVVPELTAAVWPHIVAKFGGQEDLRASVSYRLFTDFRDVRRVERLKQKKVGRRTSFRLPVRSNQLPNRSSLSPYRAAVSQ